MIKKVFSVFSRIVINLFIVFLAMVLLTNISTLLSIEKIKQGGNMKFGYACAIVKSGSMEPSISTDDFIVIKKGGSSYKTGDIITYLSDYDSLVTHRVVGISDDTYITQGDANNCDDGEIQKQRILGKVILVVPSMGLIDWIFVLISIELLICILIIIWLTRKIRED